MEVFDKSMKPRFSRSLDEREEQLRAMLRASSDSKNIPFEDAPHEVMDFKDVATGQIQDTVDGAKAEYATLELQQVPA
jgi:hypothetical protein